MNTEPKVTIVDAIMGTGKTTWAIDMMNASRESLEFGQSPRSFIYIAPLLDEAERIQGGCPELLFVDPQSVDGSKSKHLNNLIGRDENIATSGSGVSPLSFFRKLITRW